jgi:3-phenylpropionate/cinnamic acid dioxygenase small subunit
MSERAERSPVDIDDYVMIQRFLYAEVALLDRRAYQEWFALMTHDIRYRVTTVSARPAQDETSRFAIIDEDVQTLKMRVDQISDPNLTHAENPPTLTQRLVSNVEAYYGERNGVFEATSSILLYANRSGAPETGLYAGERQDVLIRDSNGFKIAKRTVNLAQTVLHDSTLSLLL